MKRTRNAPSPEEIENRRKKIRQRLGIKGNSKSMEYNPLNPDKKAILSKEENKKIVQIITEKMDKCFPSEKRSITSDGRFRIPVLIIDRRMST